MASEWKRYTIDQLKADVPAAIAIGPFGSRMKSDTYVPSGVPVIRGNNISDTKQFTNDFVFITPEFADQLISQNVTDGDLVFPHRGSIGTVGIVGSARPRYVLSTSLMKLTCNRSLVEPLYLFYFFRSRTGHHKLMEHASTVGTPGIGSPLASLRSIEVSLPPLPEQQAIACILGALDDKIELNRRMNETLEAMARAIFKSWFVDFDPVRAKAAGQKPVGLAPHIANLFPDAFEDSELGKIPKGWLVGTIGDLALLNPESWSKTTRPDVISYVDLTNTKWGRIEAVTTYLQDDAPNRAQRVLRPRDTIVGTVRPGNGSYAFISREGLTGSTGFATLRPREEECAEFVYLAATAMDNIELLSHLADGGAYPAVRPEVVAATQVIRADIPVLVAFSEAVEPLLQRIAQAESESGTLADIRDTLLAKLISGELPIPDAASIIGRSL
ncbi:MAG: restriction endonuclease subunit S [Armatimonadota bacterium]